MGVTLTGANRIAGVDRAAGSDRHRAIDAASGAPLDDWFTDATSDEVASAAAAAAAAFETFGVSPAADRAALLRRIGDAIVDLGDELIDRLDRETGLGRTRLIGERARTVGQLESFADLVADGAWVDATIDTAGPDLRRMLIPIGPVAVFGASNFPLAFSVAGGDTASALAAGCPVVYKANPGHPGGSEMVARAIGEVIESLGLPAGVFSMLHGVQHRIGVELVQDDHIDAVAFTGSAAGGLALAAAAAERARPIPVFAEMGSVNPVVVFPGALGESARSTAEELAASVVLGAGQFCTNPGLILTLGPLADELAAAVARAEIVPMLTPRIRQAFDVSVGSVVERPGVTRVTTDRGTGSPTVLETDAQTFLADPQLRHEMFGPATLVVNVADVDELLRVIGALGGQLTATLRATPDEISRHPDVMSALVRRVGRLLFGGVPTGVAVSPAQQHGGPFPATTDVRFTSVGTAAIARFARPITYQDVPPALLPPELHPDNPLGIDRFVVGADVDAD